MAAVADPRLRQLKIKTGVLKRLLKEKTMYEKEVVDQGQKVEKMKAEGKDSHDVNKQIEVLEESKIMIPDCKRRIKTAYEDLKNLVVKNQARRACRTKAETSSRRLDEWKYLNYICPFRGFVKQGRTRTDGK